MVHVVPVHEVLRAGSRGSAQCWLGAGGAGEVVQVVLDCGAGPARRGGAQHAPRTFEHTWPHTRLKPHAALPGRCWKKLGARRQGEAASVVAFCTPRWQGAALPGGARCTTQGSCEHAQLKPHQRLAVPRSSSAPARCALSSPAAPSHPHVVGAVEVERAVWVLRAREVVHWREYACAHACPMGLLCTHRHASLQACARAPACARSPAFMQACMPPCLRSCVRACVRVQHPRPTFTQPSSGATWNAGLGSPMGHSQPSWLMVGCDKR